MIRSTTRVFLLATALLVVAGCDDENATPVAEVSVASTSTPTAAPDPTPAAPESAPSVQVSTRPTSTTIPPDPYAGRRPQGAPMISFEPSATNFGIVEPKSVQTATIRIWNHGRQPLKVEKAITSCGCTKADDITGRGIAPQGHLDFNISMEMKSGLGDKKEKITIWFVGRSKSPVVHYFHAETALPVRITPSFVDATQAGSGQLLVQSQDGKPFTIKRVNGGPPQVIGWKQGDQPRNTYRLVWHLDNLRLSNMQIPWFLVLETDRDDSRLVDVRIRHATTRPNRPPGRPWVPKDQRAILNSIENGKPFKFTAKIEYAKGVYPDQGAAQVRTITPGLELKLAGTEVDDQFLVFHLEGTVRRQAPGLFYGEIHVGSSGFTTPLYLIGLVEG